MRKMRKILSALMLTALLLSMNSVCYAEEDAFAEADKPVETAESEQTPLPEQMPVPEQTPAPEQTPPPEQTRPPRCFHLGAVTAPGTRAVSGL